MEIDGKIFVAKCAEGKISNKSEAESIVSACRDKNGRIDEVEVRQFKQAPPFPFNLGALRNEAYAVFKYAPQRVLNMAQQLYLKAFISYPRTDSQKLPRAIGYRKILKNLSKKEQFKTVASELLAKEILKPNEVKKDDPAHPAIYPTGNLPDQTLSAGEKRLWELTVLRFMSVFGEPAIEQITKVSISVEGHHLNVCGRRILEKGWMHQYTPYNVFEDIDLPSIKKRSTCQNQENNLRESFYKSTITVQSEQSPWRNGKSRNWNESNKSRHNSNALRPWIR